MALPIPFSAYSGDYYSLIELYYKARESEVYYRSLRHAETKRDNYSKVIYDIESFVTKVILDINKLDYLDRYVFNSFKALTLNNEDIVLRAKNTNKIGFDLLEIDSQLSFEILKEKYRQATLKYHPDVGGSEEKMTIINIARQQFHELLSMGELGQQKSTMSDSKIFCFSLIQLILNISYDIYDIESLNKWLLFLIDNKNNINICNTEYLSVFGFLLFLCDALSRITFSNQNDIIDKILNFIKVVASEQTNIPEYMNRRISIYKDTLKTNIKPRIVLNHVLQVNNAYKYGFIDKDKYDKYIIKYNTIDNKKDEKNQILKEYLDFVGFIKLPVDNNIVYNSIPKEKIPENYGYDGSLSTLSNDQLSEYHKTFHFEPSIELIRKYTYIRIDRIIRSIIYYYNVDFNFDIYVKELLLLQEIQNKKTVLPVFINNTLSFIRLLQNHSFDQNDERLKILRELDQRDFEKRDTNGNIAIINHLSFNKISPRDYLEFASEDISIIRKAFQTESYISKSSLNDKKYSTEEYKKDALLIKELEQLKHRIWDLYKKDGVTEEERSGLIENLVKEMFEIDNKITYKEEFQIGYWINELTISYVKQKKYNEAFYWLQKFIFLPEQWKLRSSNTELEEVNKRFERCKKALKLHG